MAWRQHADNDRPVVPTGATSAPGRVGRRAGSAVWLLVAVLAACATNLPPEPGPPHLAIVRPDEWSQGFALTGELVREEECLFLRLPDGSIYGLGWPAQTVWDRARSAVIVNGVVARIGESVEMSGETVVEIAPEREFFVPPLPECVGEQFLFASAIRAPTVP